MALSTTVTNAEKWSMALAYSATNYHSEIAAEFAAVVTEGTGGEMEIVAHPGGSLFDGSEIFGAARKIHSPHPSPQPLANITCCALQ